MDEVYLLLGGNIGDTHDAFLNARTFIEARIGRITKKSSVYRSPAWGFESENDFLNQVLQIETVLDPETLMNNCLEIETALGRKRSSNTNGYSSREIDIDILLLGHLQCNTPQLTVPHPRMHQRRFTLEPLSEIAPDVIHPGFNVSVKELLELCPDQSKVQKIYQ